MDRNLAIALVLLATVSPPARGASSEGLFYEPSLLALDDFVPTIALGDVTGDGRNDVVLGTGFCAPDCEILVLPQASHGGLDPPVRYPASGERGLVVGDLNGDGRNDVLAVGGKLTFLHQSPAGGLAPGVERTPFRKALAAASGDLNGDGRLDVVTVPLPDSAPAPLVLDVYHQGPGGGFTRQSVNLTPWEWSEFLVLEVVDLDGDGRQDVFLTDGEMNRLLLVYQEPNGGFTPASIDGFASDSFFFRPAVGNFDSDPLPEILVSGVHQDPRAQPAHPLFRFDQAAPRQWHLAQTMALDLPTGQVVAGDLDGDGRDDLVTIPFAPLGKREAHVFLQGGSGELRLVERFEIPFGNYDGPQVAAIGDLNHDTLPDLAITDDNFGLVTLVQKGSGNPPPAPELFSPAVPDFGFTVRISSGDATPALAGALVPTCIPETVCVSGALPGRAEVFLRVVGPKPNGRLWPTMVKFTTSQVDVWVHQISTGEVRFYRLPGAARGQAELPGLFDRTGFGVTPLTGFGSPVADPATAPPPPDEFFTSDEVPGFRVHARITNGGSSQSVRKEEECIEETLCLSGALPGRSEVFVRVVGPKPNGRLWPTLVKFTTSTVEVWIEQISTGDEKYYRIEGARPGHDELIGVFDRGGFKP